MSQRLADKPRVVRSGQLRLQCLHTPGAARPCLSERSLEQLPHLDDAVPAVSPDRLTRAVALYEDGSVSLGRAAEISGLALADFIQHVSRQGIPVVRGENTVREDVEAVEAWPG